MIAIIGLFTIIILSITVVRIGAICLELTGLSPEVASFQAQSAFSGAGFTTSESETVVSHPVRRRIARFLILLGGAGITSTIATLILTFLSLSKENIAFRGTLMAGGLLAIFLMARSKLIYHLMKSIIVKALSRSKALNIYDYQELLGISKGFSISSTVVPDGHWAVGNSLKELRLSFEGTLVLSIQRVVDGAEKFLVPTGETIILPGDKMTMYGRCTHCQCFSKRKKGKEGDHAHQKRVEMEEIHKEMLVKSGGIVES